jgi:hypothetical protein
MALCNGCIYYSNRKKTHVYALDYCVASGMNVAINTAMHIYQ